MSVFYWFANYRLLRDAKVRNLERMVELYRESIDRLTARIEELRGELLERAEAHYGAVKAIQKQRVTSASLKHRIAALELELAATHERARALDRNLTIKSDELAAIKEESAETCRKLLEDNHRLELQLAGARKEREYEDKILNTMVQIKRAADGKESLISNQGQALDGYSELANYRYVIGKHEEHLRAAVDAVEKKR